MKTSESIKCNADLLRHMIARMESTGEHMLDRLPGNISPAEHEAIQEGALALEEKAWNLSPF